MKHRKMIVLFLGLNSFSPAFYVSLEMESGFQELVVGRERCG